jgi:hypothetical protein
VEAIMPVDSAAQPASTSGQLSERLKTLLRTRPQFRNGALVLLLLTIPLSLAAVWFIWFKSIPAVWGWGFDEMTWRAVPAVLAAFFLAILPIYLPVGSVLGTLSVLAMYADQQTVMLKEAVKRGSDEQAMVEEELRGIDQSGLVLLLRYSRLQLEAYYGIGLTQTQRSFAFSVIAMWIGFAVIIIGILIRVIDLGEFGLRPLDSDTSTLVILAGAVIEIVSALFLWVYRSSVRQLTYFYDRQMYNHSVLMCHRISETMTAADDVKKAIIERVLDKTWEARQEALPKGKQVMALAAGK